MLSVPLTSSLSIYISGEPQALSLFPVPVYAEMVEGSTLEACMKADICWRSVRGTPNTRPDK